MSDAELRAIFNENASAGMFSWFVPWNSETTPRTLTREMLEDVASRTPISTPRPLIVSNGWMSSLERLYGEFES